MEQHRGNTALTVARRNPGLTIGGVVLGLVLITGILALPDIVRYLKIKRM
jgi:hypothetical protein